MRFSIKSTALALTLTILLGVGVAIPSVKAKDTLRVAFITDARTFDPATITRDYTGYAAVGAMYDFLVQYERVPQPDGTVKVDTTKVVPMLAERWEHNADMSEWTFYLRKDAVFHSGNPVNAQAVKYTFTRYRKTKLAAKTVLWLAKITEKGMEVLDEHTIRFKLEGPNPLLLDYLQMLNLGIQDPKTVEAHGGVMEGKINEWVARNDCGSGPFKLVSYKPGVEIVFERFERYWGPKPKIKKVIYQIIPEESTRAMLLERGKTDIMWWIPSKDYALLSKKKNLKVIGRPTIKINYIDMNRNHPPFNNPLVRKALAYSFPYKSVINNVLYGRAIQMTSPASQGSPGHTSEFFHYKQDLKKAKELLAKAGYKDGLSFSFQIGEGRIPNNKEVAVTWQAELSKIGVKMDINVLPQAVFLDKLKNGKVPIFMVAWTSFVTDPWYQFGFLLGSKSFCNYARIKDPQLDAWIEQASTMVDKKARYALARKVQKYVIDNDLWIFMFQPIADTAMNKRVKGFCLNPDDQFHVRTIYFE
ncbi:MAG: ABC transporter substrate-binding protein [Deltaproteobacteria bacterium]|nr:ABC transporter substrate-binding protein [Deltaproteobacteria bacterium]MBW2016923.1 ABC transporter substrate-binding protein [Deltaproteobacteria bacterium]MBW2129387.1 ABC transporter substrate-binding protein [Deltaproteobacteria bacterium]MBW2303729.1 ABC transporter substrate-binding protein [Deltaproteobacteria bacterium]